MVEWLNDDLTRWLAGADPYVKLAQLEGEVVRAKEGRRTFRCQLGGGSYFVKLYRGVGWGEIVKNLLQLRLPVIGAQNEWRAIKRLQQLGVATMQLAGYGKRGWNPARQQSFVITAELAPTISLEHHCHPWPANPPPFAHKLALLKQIARISQTLHRNGVCHRDFYLCHFLLHPDPAAAAVRLSLIDLHRVLCKRRLQSRWVVKDLGGLLFSAANIGLTRRDLLRFMRYYDGTDVRTCLTRRARFWRTVQQRARRIQRRHDRHNSPDQPA